MSVELDMDLEKDVSLLMNWYNTRSAIKER